MAISENSYLDLILNKLAKESTIRALVGSSVYLGMTIKNKDIVKYMPMININAEGYGQGNLYGGKVFKDFVVIESCDETDLSKAYSAYDACRKYLLQNNQIKGNNFSLNIYEQSPPKHTTGWDNKVFIVKGTWKVIWKRST